MAWTATDIIPAQLNLSALYSQSNPGALNDVHFAITPLTSTNAKFDCTAASSLSVISGGNLALPADMIPTVTVVPTLGTHSTNGLTGTISQAQINELCALAGTLSIPILLTASDGTTPLQIAKGTLNISVVP